MAFEDGATLDLLGNVESLLDSRGHPRGAVAVLSDISVRKRAERTLAASEEKYRALVERLRGLFENATVGMYRTTPDGRILMANPALIELLGYSSFEELAGRNLEQEGFEPAYSRSTFRELLESQGAVTGIEAIWTRRDGSAFIVRESAKAVRAPDGGVLYYDGIVEDFTERKRAEDALRESEERFRNIADTCPVIIWYGDANQQIRFLNKQAGVFTGRDPEELLGPNWAEYVHPDDKASLDSVFTSAISEHSGFRAEIRLRRYDGEYRWMLDTAVPRLVGGTYIGHIGIVVDVTELKQNQQQVREQLESLVNERARTKDANARLLEEIAERRQTEEMLRESRANLEAALASMADAVLITDAQAHFIDFNDAVAKFCRFGTRDECPKTLAGYLDILDVLLTDGTPVPEDMRALPRALRGETVAGAEYTLRRKDTGETWIGSLSFSPIRGKDGAILGAVIVWRDITEQKRIEEHRRHAQKLESIGVLAGGIAHDFNNLLTSILGSASMLQMDPAVGGNQRLTTIIESSERAAALTRQLLAYAGKGHFQVTDFDLSRLVRSSVDLIGVSIPKNVDFRLDIPAALPLVRGDSSQIQQVVMNLAINAAEAIDTPEGKVTISARAQALDAASAARISPDIAAGHYISIRVRDNGCGMDAATKARIFDPALDDKIYRTRSGTGGGPGDSARGTKERLRWKARSAVAAQLRSTCHPASTPGAAASRKDEGQVDVRAATVLVVDDEEPVRAVTQAALETHGYRVLLAGDGRQAADLLESRRRRGPGSCWTW